MRIRRLAFLADCRTTLAWGLLFYLSFQVVLLLITAYRLPELRDLEYASKLRRLRQRLAEEPGRPLIVILGSSRAGYGIRPEVVRDWRTLDGGSPIVFNFGMTGSGPILELLCLHRLLAAGIHPTQVILEVLPPSLNQTGTRTELHWTPISRLGWEDLQLMRHYSELPRQLCFDWWRMQCMPCFALRFALLSRCAPGWPPWRARRDIWQDLDRSGWMIYPHTILNAMEQRRAREFARGQYAPAFADFRITSVADRPLRDLLALCRRQGIKATLLLMPEGPEFQSWYPPHAWAEVDAYLACLSREYDATRIDARSWLPETAFFDSHHLHPDGATAFTQCLARELPKLVATRRQEETPN